MLLSPLYAIASACSAAVSVQAPVQAPGLGATLPSVQVSLPSLAAPGLGPTLAPLPGLTLTPAASLPSVQAPPLQTLSGVARSLERAAPGSQEAGRVSAAAFDGFSLPAVDAGPVAVDPSGARPSELRFAGDLVGSDGFEAVPGSVFGWRPIEDSPGHGIPILDRLIRRILGAKDSRFSEGFEVLGAERRRDARVYLYGERHTDAPGALQLARDVRPGRDAIVLVESYLGPDLRGSEALDFLETRGLDPGLVKAGSGIEVRGWDTAAGHDASTHDSLQHHMDLLALNHLAYSDLRGPAYYAQVVRYGLAALRSCFRMRRLAIGRRNQDLDAALRQALESDASVHVIAGAEHLVDRPLLVKWPVIGGYKIRKGLLRAIDGRPFWAGKPPDAHP
ncbi:MAG: hypothetical protein WC728_15745 [Elusimicrobiota bacterium]